MNHIYIFQVDIEKNISEPIDNTNSEEFQNMDQTIPEYSKSISSSIESSIYPVARNDDVSFHNKGTGVYKALCTKNYHSVMSLEGKTVVTELGNGDSTMNEIKGLSND